MNMRIACFGKEEGKNRSCIEDVYKRQVCSNCGKVYHERMLKGSETCADCGGKLIIRKDDKDVYKRQAYGLE